MTQEIKDLTDPIVCQGIKVRTTNLDETNYDTAKLGGLWQKFYKTKFDKLAEGATIYGIYQNYETDDTGAFDVVAAWEKGSLQTDLEDIDYHATDQEISVTIPAGRYMVFTEKGKMPNMVIDAWEKVWAYFNDPSCEHTRTFGVDFEHYVDGNLEYGQVDLYIGIK